MKQSPTIKEVSEMPIYRFIWFLQRLGMATMVVSSYITCVELGPRLHNQTFTLLREAPLLGLPIPVQMLTLAVVLAICHWWNIKKHHSLYPFDSQSILTVNGLMEALPPEVIGVIFGSVSYFPVYLMLDVFKV